MKKITAFILGLLIMAAMTVEWKVASFLSAGSAIHNYHGICNDGVGRTYEGFIHELRTMAEAGDTNRLVTVLHRSEEHSRDLYEVWLAGDRDAYRKSLDEILK